MKRKTIENDLYFLRQISTDVDFENDDYLDYIKKLKEYCENDAVYALAPVQIGIPKRIIYLRNTNEDMSKKFDGNYNENKVLINPEIINKKGKTKFLERCASCMDFVGVVERPYFIEVGYYDINKKYVTEIFEGFEATVFSHEFDHLNGILHIDLCEKVMEMNIDETREYRNKHPYEIISKE